MRALSVLASLAAGGVAVAALFVALAAATELQSRGCLAVGPSGWWATADCADAATATLLGLATALMLAALSLFAARRRGA